MGYIPKLQHRCPFRPGNGLPLAPLRREVEPRGSHGAWVLRASLQATDDARNQQTVTQGINSADSFPFAPRSRFRTFFRFWWRLLRCEGVVGWWAEKASVLVQSISCKKPVLRGEDGKRVTFSGSRGPTVRPFSAGQTVQISPTSSAGAPP